MCPSYRDEEILEEKNTRKETVYLGNEHITGNVKHSKEFKRARLGVGLQTFSSVWYSAGETSKGSFMIQCGKQSAED